MSEDQPTRKRIKRPIPVSIAEEQPETVSLELDVGSATFPIGFRFRASREDFELKLEKLLIQLPTIIEQLTPESELPFGQDPVKFVAGAYTIAASDCVVIVDTSMGAVTISLPSATIQGKRLIIVKETSDGNTVTVSPFGNDTIESSSSKSLTAQWNKAVLESDGVSNWLDLGTGIV